MTSVGYLSSRILAHLSTCRNVKNVCKNVYICKGILSDSQSHFLSSIGPGKCSFMTTTKPLCSSKNSTEETFEVTFIRPNGEKVVGKGKAGDTLLDVVNNNGLDLDGYGQCDGTLACSTCHVKLTPTDFDAVEDEVSSLESDLLDDAFGRTPTSRLGCQVKLSKELGNFEVKLPNFTKDQRES
ncbi:adrenodoxin-like protein 2, mitochondrial isoform X1 [Nilaparvata lugens]|uniref:adrenodoxin-like protein 2, mitochondrial isoform X2 n=1 Tax=Nilaparvata lugens TaxID=108931 RepID=UPI00193DC1AA|nr:adrenodoxin-like protein 2, mitochondrial isoform X2 [Nilaparvata lugens]XP_039289586.1 adrenodoxin-like protein 2, mitochondrial isoform X1 [Nilaparvata lugens]